MPPATGVPAPACFDHLILPWPWPAPRRDPGGEIAAALRRLQDDCAPATLNGNRAAVVSWLNWCATGKRWVRPAAARRRRAAQGEHSDSTRALPRGRVERLLSCRDIPLREQTLWRTLYETAGRPRRGGHQRRGRRLRTAPRAHLVQGQQYRVRLLAHRDRALPAPASAPARRQPDTTGPLFLRRPAMRARLRTDACGCEHCLAMTGIGGLRYWTAL
jgi:hypothetical protein